MKRFILLLMIITSPLAFSDSIHFGVYTRHIVANDLYNNDNNLVALKVGDYFASSFNNSFGYQTYFIGKEKTLTNNISIMYGLSHGYSVHCFLILGGSNQTCDDHKSEPDFVPLMTVRLHQQIGPFILSTMIADYVNVSIGMDF